MDKNEKTLIKTLGFGIKTFIEKSIEGGWNGKYELLHLSGVDNDGVMLRHLTNKRRIKALIVTEILLDPKAWEAVGKSEGWRLDDDKTTTVTYCEGCKKTRYTRNEWEEYMHLFVSNLIEE